MQGRLLCWITHFLQEVCNTFPLRTFEAHCLKELEDVFSRSLVYDLALGEENNVIKEVIRLRCRLKQRDERGSS
ncbi:Os02g0208400 [Oryza sativa Japonica Group]|uniref:Os02g0208400 protein n=1 Tax=Oryza sativa subsp. japonica TaxID=39947 RepID=A0A0P0VG70_ORYSJ|nr:hypothetical protein EE612_009668 [Oryza sativa]BAS77572.1 Os02g0208400 [Oryza sativa Japonica Group]